MSRKIKFTTFSDILKKYANGWIILVFFVLVLLFSGFIIPTVETKLKAVSGGNGFIDMQLFYTPEKVYSMIESYGNDGRMTYRIFTLTGDLIYPIIYSVFFSLLIIWLFKRGFAPDSKMHKLNIVVFGALLFDLLENVCLVLMFSLYPYKSTTIAWISTIFTTLKWTFGAIGITLVIIGLIMATKNKFKKQ